MKRRYFLGSLAAAPAALPLANQARGAVRAGEVQGREAVRELLIQESPVAGFQYHAGETVWPRLSAGDPLRLLRVPGNPHDRACPDKPAVVHGKRRHRRTGSGA